MCGLIGGGVPLTIALIFDEYENRIGPSIMVTYGEDGELFLRNYDRRLFYSQIIDFSRRIDALS